VGFIKPMPEDTHIAAASLSLMLEASRELCCLGAAEPYRFYEALHRMAARIAPAEAFYICLYSEAEQSLFFPYNHDLGIYDPPLTVPLGNGPTSWVIRHKKAYVWNSLEERERVQPGGFHFGNLDTATVSAAHLPIRAPGAASEAALLGVLSAQSYTPNAYTAHALCLLQWLADRAGQALAHEQAASLAAERQQHAATLVDQCVQMISRISRDAQAVSALTPPECPALRQAAAELLRTCYRSQTEANQLLLHPHRLSPPSPPAPTAPPLALLTEREREILSLLASGHTNGEIGKRLFIATNTVKDHLKRIFVKIDVSSRHEATQWFRTSSQ